MINVYIYCWKKVNGVTSVSNSITDRNRMDYNMAERLIIYIHNIYRERRKRDKNFVRPGYNCWKYEAASNKHVLLMASTCRTKD
jgi:hypothetical protein